MMKTFKIACSFVLLLSVSSCVRIRYDKIDLALQYQGSGLLTVSVLDHRPYVVSGEKTPSFVALVRNGYGMPFSYNTASGAALSQDLTTILKENFTKIGFIVETRATTPSMSQVAALSAMKSGAQGKKALLVLNEWKSDTLVNSWFKYSATFTVFDLRGKRLASETIAGEDAVDGSFWNPASAANKAVPQKSREVLQNLLNRPSIVRALR